MDGEIVSYLNPNLENEAPKIALLIDHDECLADISNTGDSKIIKEKTSNSNIKSGDFLHLE